MTSSTSPIESLRRYIMYSCMIYGKRERERERERERKTDMKISRENYI